MDQQAQRNQFWRSLRELPGRMPLRTKLISAVLALVAVALLVISVVGITFLQSSLIGPVNSQLYAYAAQGQPVVAQAVTANGNVTGFPTSMKVDWYPVQGKARQISAERTGPGRYSIGPPGSGAPGPEVTPGAAWLTSGRPTAVPAASGSALWQVLSQPLETPSGQVAGYVIYAWDVTSIYRTIHKLVLVDWIVSAVLLGGLAIVGIAVIGRSLRPLIDIEQTAGAIAAGDLSRRVPERDPRTEVGRLGRSLNVMLSHIEAAFHARSMSEAAARRSEDKMRQFVADASHELRTPLTTIRGSAEYFRQRGGIASGDNGAGHLKAADMDRIMRRVEQESARMGVLVEDMLLLARLDQQRPLQAKPVDLLTLAADAVHDARLVAPDRSIQLTVGSTAALIVNGDEVRLRQVIGNLMTNALTHTPAGTPIDVLIRSGTLDEAPARTPEDPDAPSPVASHQPAAVLEVADHGPGLEKEQAEHVFERFYRADPARTAGGTGLGLAIVAALVAGHGGATWVRSEPDEGATFCIALPLTPEAAEGPDDDGPADLSDAEQEHGQQANPDDAASAAESDDSGTQQFWARLDSPGG